jgi:hypothetical protein
MMIQRAIGKSEFNWCGQRRLCGGSPGRRHSSLVRPPQLTRRDHLLMATRGRGNWSRFNSCSATFPFNGQERCPACKRRIWEAESDNIVIEPRPNSAG